MTPTTAPAESQTSTLRHYFTALFGGPEGIVRRRSYAANETIFRPGDAAGTLMLIESGRVRIVVESVEGQTGGLAKRKTLGYIEVGGFFGELALAGRGERSEFALTDRPTVILEMPIREVHRLMVTNPIIAGEVVNLLATRLAEARDEVASLVFDPVRERVLRRLLQLVDQRIPPEQLAESESVTIDITHAQLAMAVGAARETVSTDVEQLKKQGVLQIRRGRLEIKIDRLRRELSAAVAERTADDTYLRRMPDLGLLAGRPPLLVSPR